MNDNLYYKYNPEKRNIYIETFSSRNNFIIYLITGIFMLAASGASALIEVFMRVRFGERYITLAQSIGLFLVLMGWGIVETFSFNGYGFLTCIYALAYLYLSIIHRLEISKYGTTYDFKRFSLSNGEPNDFFKKIIGAKVFGTTITKYRYNMIIEPGIPFVIGLLLMSTQVFMTLGIVLTFCGFVFGIRNFVIANRGRNFVLDIIDNKITSESSYDVLVKQKPPSQTKGVYLPIELPKDQSTREAIYRATKSSTDQSNDIWENDYLED